MLTRHFAKIEPAKTFDVVQNHRYTNPVEYGGSVKTFVDNLFKHSTGSLINDQNKEKVTVALEKAEQENPDFARGFSIFACPDMFDLVRQARSLVCSHIISVKKSANGQEINKERWRQEGDIFVKNVVDLTKRKALQMHLQYPEPRPSDEFTKKLSDTYGPQSQSNDLRLSKL